jgi:hypothetical protein
MLRGSVIQAVFWPASTLKPNPTSLNPKRVKDPFFKNHKRGAQIVLRKKAVVV